MTEQTTNPVQVGPPKILRLNHLLTNHQCYMVSPDAPLPGHYWMIQRVNITLPFGQTAQVANQPILCNLYSAPQGVIENTSGTLLGIYQNGALQGPDLILCDSGTIAVSGTTIPVPYLTADEDHAVYISENRVPIIFMYGYATTVDYYIQAELQYVDWILSNPKMSPIPVYETAANPSL